MNQPQFSDVQQLFSYVFDFSTIYKMNQQNYFEESQLSLSAFLCLQIKYQPQFAYPSQTVTPSQVVQNNPAYQQNEGDLESQSDLSSKDQSSQSKSQIGKSKKQKKEYSKNYRIRHKEYVKNLQITNQKLQKKVEELNLKIDELTQEVQCLKYGRKMNVNFQLIQDHLFDNMFMRQKQNNFKKLVNLAETQKQSSWQKIKEFADYYGFAGKQKINLLNYYMSQIIDNLLTDSLKNVVLGGLENFEISKPYAQTMYEKQREVIGCSKANFNYLLKYLRKNMSQRIKKFHNCGKDFYSSYVNLMNEAKEIENHFSSIQQGVFKMLPADKYLAILKWYEQNKYCKQIQLLRKDWFESFRQK